MVKKAPVTQIYQVDLYCDKCGARMNYDHFDVEDGKVLNTYICRCGYQEISKIIYPHQQVFFDEANATEVSEDEA